MRPGDIVVVHRTSFDVCDMSPLTSNETPALGPRERAHAQVVEQRERDGAEGRHGVAPPDAAEAVSAARSRVKRAAISR